MMSTTERANGISRVGAPQRILQSVLKALNQGRISQAVGQFDDDLTLNDHALDLDCTDKGRLKELLEKCRGLSPDAAAEVISIFEAETASLLNGSSTQPRLCRLAQRSSATQFPYEEHRSCKSRMEE